MKLKYFIIAVPAGIDSWKDCDRRRAEILAAYVLAHPVEECCKSLTKKIKKLYGVSGHLFCTLLSK